MPHSIRNLNNMLTLSELKQFQSVNASFSFRCQLFVARCQKNKLITNNYQLKTKVSFNASFNQKFSLDAWYYPDCKMFQSDNASFNQKFRVKGDDAVFTNVSIGQCLIQLEIVSPKNLYKLIFCFNRTMPHSIRNFRRT